jgi:hypothetical protein
MYDVSYLNKINSIDKNKIIRAVNAGTENPFPKREECKKFYDSLMKTKRELDAEHPDMPLVYALVDPDESEEEMLMGLLPD